MGTTLIILLSTVLPIGLTVLVVTRLLGGLQREKADTDRLLATGQPAQGRVLHLASGGETVTVMGHRHLRVALGLEVHLPGRPPYQAQIQPLVSELLLPSLQPGVFVQLRVDPANPQRVAVASAAPGPMGGASWTGPAPAFAPPDVGGAMKKSLPFMIGIFAFTTIPITAIMLYTFVDVGAIFGTSGPKGGYCEAAARCCKAIGQGSGSCDNWASGSMPVEGCKRAYDGYKKAATAMKKTCE